MADGPVNGAPQITWANIIGGIGVLALLAGGAWTINQLQFSYAEKDTNRTEKAIERIDAELLLRRSQFPTQSEFQQYEKRIDKFLEELQARLRIIEQTRPTTGELQSIARSADNQISRIIDRLDKIEARR